MNTIMTDQDNRNSIDPNPVVKVSELRKTVHGPVLCYPGNELSTFYDRVSQLRELGISNLIFEGSSKVGRFGIVGKGCVSIVVKAKMKSNDTTLALKIRRTDADRPSMSRDYELQNLANSFGVGPRALSATPDLFLMEYIDSLKIGNWFRSLKTRAPKKYVKRLLRNCLDQCFVLDSNHLDHGELSNPSKHILIKMNGSQMSSEGVIIDFESASVERKPANLTAASQFFFFGNYQSKKMRKILEVRATNKKIISALHEYKERPTLSSFENFMSLVNC